MRRAVTAARLFTMKLTVCAAFVALAAGLGVAPAAAAAEDPAAVRVTPRSVGPGDEVELRVTGCEDAHGVARSAAFVAEARLAPSPEGGLTGEARVSSTARPGEQPVDVACDGEEAKFTGRLAIVDGNGGGSGDPAQLGGLGEPGDPVEATPPERDGSVRQDASSVPTQDPRPTAPVRAGGGGTATGPGAAGASLDIIGPAGLAVLSGALVSCMLLTVRRRSRRS
jgi:hypothetical protein